MMWSEKPTRSTQVPALPPISFATSPSRQQQPPLSHVSKPTKFKEAPHSSSSFVNDEPRAMIDHDRLQELDSRVSSMEQANKALLEELMLVHGKLKHSHSLQDELAQEVNYLRNKLETKNSFLEDQLDQRVARNEADVVSNKDTAESLLLSSREMKHELHKVIDRVGELSTELTKCKGALCQMENESAKQDVWLKESFAHLRDQISWLSQQMSSSLNSLVSDFEHLEQRVTTEHAQLVSRLTSDLKANSTNASEQSDKMRGALEKQMSGLEKLMYDERDSQMKSKSELHGVVNRQQEELNNKLYLMDKTLEDFQKKCDQQISAVSTSLSVVAKRCSEDQGELSTVLNAEIKMRQREVEKVYSHCQRTQEMCRSSVGALREGLLSLEERVSTGKREAHSFQNDMIAEFQDVSKRLQADVSARMTALHDHIKAIGPPTGERGTNSGGSPGKHILSEKVPETVSQLNLQYEHLQRMLNGEIEALQKQIGQHSNQLSGLNSALQNLQLRMVGMIQQETSQRFHSILDVKKEMADLHGRLPLTAPPATHSLSLSHSQQRRQLVSDHTSLPSNTSHDKTQEHQHEAHNPETNASTAITGGNNTIPRPTGVITKAYSPFPDAEGGELSMSDESESQEDSEGEDDEGGVYPDQGTAGGGGGHTHVTNRTRHFGDQFETSPEPHSLQSSITENIMIRSKNILRQQHARSRPSRSQRHRNRQIVPHPLVQVRYYDDPETQGTFTSAPPTPASQRRVLVMGSGSRPHTADGDITPHSTTGILCSGQQVESQSDIGDVECQSRAEEELPSHSNEEEIASHFIHDDSHSEGEHLSDEFDSEGERVTDQEIVQHKEDEDREVELDGSHEGPGVLHDDSEERQCSDDGDKSIVEGTSENVVSSCPQKDECSERELNPEPDDSTQLHLESSQQQNDPLLSQTGGADQGNGTNDNELDGSGDEMVFQMS